MLSKQAIWHHSKDYFMIMVGLICYAFGFTAFILPHSVVIGGLPGVATLIHFKTGIPVGYSLYTLNILLLLLAYKIVGRQFVLKTFFGSTGLSFFLVLGEYFFKAHPIAIQDDILLNCIIGAVFCGTGVGMALAHNGSTGGTDVIAAMVTKYRQVSVGRMILYVDMLVISSSYLMTHNLDRVVYGFVVLVFLSYMADLMVNNTKQAVRFTIFSKKWQDIATAVNTEAHRGCTILDGTGWYTKQEVKMLVVFCRKSEALQIYRIIFSIDAHAFVSEVNVNTVYGEGFDVSKVKPKSRVPHTVEETEDKK